VEFVSGVPGMSSSDHACSREHLL